MRQAASARCASCRSPTRPRAELPLPRLLRLSLFQVSVGMATALLVGTLNRVMIVELRRGRLAGGADGGAAAGVRAVPRADRLPLRHPRSVLGWRRVPYIWIGTLLQFGGLAIMPFALLVLSGDGQRARPGSATWRGLAFLLVGAGLQTTQTAGLALATDLATERIASARGGADVRDAAAGHGRRRRCCSALLLADFSRQAADPGGAGRGGADHVAQRHRAVEAGSARPGRRRTQVEPAPAFAPDAGAASSRASTRAASCWPWRWAPPPSTCRTSCSSPMAARSWT